MKDALAIILYDHPWEHTADYAAQTSKFLSRQNIVIGVLLKDAQSVKEMIVGHRRIWFWNKVHANYYIVKPCYIIPFRRFKTIIRMNIVLNMVMLRLAVEALSAYKSIQHKYLWIFNPEHYGIIKLFTPSFRTIYDCVDYHGDTEGGKNEKELIRSCDWAFVNSRTLLTIHKKVRSDIVLVPLGFDRKTFSHMPPRSPRLTHDKPIIGYIGGINSRLDFFLLLQLIRKNPGWHFVFIGPIQKHEREEVFQKTVKPSIDALFRFPHVQHIHAVPKSMVAAYIAQFSLCMIPYDPSRSFSAFCFPMKVFEYFYMGKPVVSTPIHELKRFPKYVKIGNTREEWEKHITSLLSHPWKKSYQKEQKKIAEENSWDYKISRIVGVIDNPNIS